MDVCSSRKDECPYTDPTMMDGHEEEHPLFLDFPSPFFDNITTIPILEDNHSHEHHLNSPNKPLNISEPSSLPLPSESKHLKRRSAGKKDRHSKIHTAQGIRDRRMRLSLHIARKFFDLQDLLGFDKASNTIEWLFCKSNKAIKEVAKNFNPKQTNQIMSEEIKSVNKVSTNKPDSPKEDDIKNNDSRKRMQTNASVREIRDQARARARDRTRERLMIKELHKSKQLSGGNPKDEIYKLGLGYLTSPNNQNLKELGYISCPSEQIQQNPLGPSIEHSSTHHLLGGLQSSAIDVNNFGSYPRSVEGTSTYWSTLFNPNLPAGWLNSCNGFIEMPGEWDAGNYGIVPTTYPLTGDIYEQNPSSLFMSTTTNILHFQSLNQGK